MEYYSKCIQLFPLDFLKGVKGHINAEAFKNSCELTAGDSVICGDYMLHFGFFNVEKMTNHCALV